MTGQGEDRPIAPYRDQPRGEAGLLIIDMINAFDFPGGDALRKHAEDVVSAILALRGDADRAGVPTIYVNDNFGEWHSERSALVRGARDRLVDDRIAPRDKDYFIIKPQLSGFYATNLQVLLPKLGISRLIITGVAADMCVLLTAADASMRDYDVWIPADCVAAESSERRDAALTIAAEGLGAQIAPTSELAISAWRNSGNENPPIGSKGQRSANAESMADQSAEA